MAETTKKFASLSRSTTGRRMRSPEAGGVAWESDLSARGLDDLVFDPDEFTLTQPRGKGSEKRTASRTRPEAARPKERSIQSRFPMAYLVIAALVIGVLGVGSYFLCSEEFAAQTKLLYMSNDQKAKTGLEWPLDKELEIIRNPELISLFAHDLFGQFKGATLTGGQEAICFPAFLADARAKFPEGLASFASPAEFAKWLTESLGSRLELTGNTAKVTLDLKGKDPQFLQAVLDAFVHRYADFRRALEAEKKGQFLHVANNVIVPESPSDNGVVDMLSDQVHKLDMQVRGCEVALQLIDSGKGTFRGFLPDANMTGVSLLGKFQDKIVQLEITKRAVAVRYNPNSREMRSLDQEIEGIRAAMRECLIEHLHYLKKGKESLVVQKGEVERRRTPLSSNTADDKGTKAQYFGDLPSGDTWFLVREGLFVFRNKPSITKKPWLVKAGEHKDALLASFGSFSAPATIKAVAGSGGSLRASALQCSMAEPSDELKESSGGVNAKLRRMTPVGQQPHQSDRNRSGRDLFTGAQYLTPRQDSADSGQQLLESLRAEN